MKLPVLWGACALAGVASAFCPPVDVAGDVRLQIVGFDEDASRKPRYRVVSGSDPFDYEVVLSNGTASVVAGPVTSVANDDWDVAPGSCPVEVPPGETRTCSFTCRPQPGRVISELYPIHANFGTLHAVAVFKADLPKREPWNKVAPLWEWWTSSSGELWTAEGRDESGWRELERRTDGRDVYGVSLAEGVSARVIPGAQGLTDGVIVFSAGDRRLSWRGFAVCVDGHAVGAAKAGDVRFSKVECRRTKDGAFEVLHHLPRKDGDGIVLRASLWADGGTLRMKWDMPGVVRRPDGTPRYTTLHLGPCSESPARVYAGMGVVVEQPKKFDLRGGADLATRHVGADFPCGLSVVQAADVFPDYFIVRGDERRFQLVVQGDATLTLAPSERGVFPAARLFAKVANYRKSPGYDRCSTRICLDDWWTRFPILTDSVRRYAGYGVTNAVFIKHGWSKWDYDNRAPDYHPASNPAAMRELSETARNAGIDYGVHENYIDFYPDAAGFSYDHIMHTAVSGRPHKAWYNSLRSAQSYRACPDHMYPFAVRNAKRAKEDFSATALFVDVFGAMQPLEYYDRKGVFHTRVECAYHWGNIYDTYRDCLGVPDAIMVSEAGTDLLIGHLDAGQCDHHDPDAWAKRGVDFADGARVPWHDIVTHGKFVMMGGGLPERYGKPYGSDDYLETTAIGGRMPMCSGVFSRAGVMTDWLLRPWWVCVSQSEMVGFGFENGDIRRRLARFSNGAAIRSNRSTNAVWRVDGETLPAFGFVARGPGYEGGIVLKDGQRVAFARTPSARFVDARPVPETPVAAALSSAVVDGRSVARNRIELTVKWTVNQAVGQIDGSYVHVLDAANAKEGPILFGGRLKTKAEQFERPGTTFETKLEVEVPDSAKAGSYAVKYGMLRKGSRVMIDAVRDGRNRVLGGSIQVVKEGGRVSSVQWLRPPTKDEELLAKAKGQEMNIEGKIVDFGAIRTNGAFLLEEGRASWTVRPLPFSRPFSARLDLSALGNGGRKVADVVAAYGASAPKWRQEGDILGFVADGKASAYEITFE